MLEELFHGIVDFSEQFIVPEWGSLIALLPLGLALLVGLYLSWTVFRFATAGPVRRGVRKLPPVAPAGIHMPGPSFAPLLAAFGMFMLVFGLITGGPWLVVGLLVLIITLLYWGREALRDYDHIPEATSSEVATLPAVAHAGPPPGVHMPPPSFRPLTVSLGMAILVAGMVVGGSALLFGLLAIAVVLLDWLRDERKAYVATVEADRTGHLDLGGSPAWPMGTFAALAVIIASALLLGSGILPSSETAGGGTAASAVPGAPSGPAPSATTAIEADATVTAAGIVFLETELTVPAGREFTLALDNQDSGTPHNVEIKQGDTIAFKGDIFNGVEVRVYTVPALAAVAYDFLCTVHPNMKGTLTAR